MSARDPKKGDDQPVENQCFEVKQLIELEQVASPLEPVRTAKLHLCQCPRESFQAPDGFTVDFSLDVVKLLSEWVLLSLLTGRRGEGSRLETNSTLRSRPPRRYCVDAGEESSDYVDDVFCRHHFCRQCQCCEPFCKHRFCKRRFCRHHFCRKRKCRQCNVNLIDVIINVVSAANPQIQNDIV